MINVAFIVLAILLVLCFLSRKYEDKKMNSFEIYTIIFFFVALLISRR